MADDDITTETPEGEPKAYAKPVPKPVVWFRDNSIAIVGVVLLALAVCLIGHYSSTTIDWARTEDFTDVFRNVTQGLAFILGGIWAYFKFRKSRTFKESLIPVVSGKLTVIDDLTYLVVTTQVKNVGQSIIYFAQDASSLKLFQYISSPATEIVTVTDEKLTQFDALHETDKYIEPNEVIENTRLILIPQPSALGFRLELEVISTLDFTWRASFIVQKSVPSDNITRVLTYLEGGPH